MPFALTLYIKEEPEYYQFFTTKEFRNSMNHRNGGIQIGLHCKIQDRINILAPAMFYIRSTKNYSYVDRAKQYIIPVV